MTRNTRGKRVSSDYSSKGWLFGWCLPDDGTHDRCIGTFTSRMNDHTYTCSCYCHGVSQDTSN